MSDVLDALSRLIAVGKAGTEDGVLSEVALASVVDELEAVFAGQLDEAAHYALMVGRLFLKAARSEDLEDMAFAMASLQALLAFLTPRVGSV